MYIIIQSKYKWSKMPHFGKNKHEKRQEENLRSPDSDTPLGSIVCDSSNFFLTRWAIFYFVFVRVMRDIFHFLFFFIFHFDACFFLCAIFLPARYFQSEG